MHRARRLDQFYTKGAVARDCLRFLRAVARDFLDWDRLLWVEPSAGEGAFFRLLPESRRIGMDVEPGADGVRREDFLTWRPPEAEPDRTAVVGNPPFGHRARLATRFFNRAAEFASTIAMIVPVQFRKYSVHRNLRPDLQWIATHALPESAFYTPDNPDYRLNAEFQVWTRAPGHGYPDLRLRQPPPIRHPDFDMWQYNNTRQALHVFGNGFDFAVPRQGYQDYGRKETDADRCERTTQWILFKAHSPAALARLLRMDFGKLSRNNTITPGFGKACVVREYDRLK